MLKANIEPPMCKQKPLILLLYVILMILAACNMPQSRETTPPTLNVTQAFQTVEAHLTMAAALTPVGSLAPSPTQVTPSPTLPSPTVEQTATPTKPPVSATVPVVSCDQAAPGVPIDVTIPDDTVIPPGAAFTKTWRLTNTGTCAWTQSYAIVLFSGDALGAPSSVPLPSKVDPGKSIDISVDMVAPTLPGTYQGNWKLRNASGVLFGIGPGGASPFWVRIVVKSTTGTPTVTFTPSTPGVTVSPTPEVLVSGTTSLIPSDRIDLDTAQLNTGVGEDLGYELSSGSKLLLVPLGGARFALFGPSTPTFADCKAAPLADATISLKNLRGLFMCYQTDQGMYGWMRFLSLNTDNNNTLTIQLLTWVTP